MTDVKYDNNGPYYGIQLLCACMDNDYHTWNKAQWERNWHEDEIDQVVQFDELILAIHQHLPHRGDTPWDGSQVPTPEWLLL